MWKADSKRNEKKEQCYDDNYERKQTVDSFSFPQVVLQLLQKRRMKRRMKRKRKKKKQPHQL